MKKFIMTFLVAGLVITSVLSLSSCKKTDTNANAEEEWIPTTFNFITSDPLSRVVAYCPYDSIMLNYCDHGVEWWTRDPITHEIVICDSGPWNAETNPDGHYHEHCFTADKDCTPPDQSQTICPYKGVRYHRHIVVHWHGGLDNHWHLGGAIGNCN